MTPAKLRDKLVKHFNKGELQSLCFDLDIKFDNLRGETLEDKARELILFCQRLGYEDNLIKRCKELRPNTHWSNIQDTKSKSIQNRLIFITAFLFIVGVISVVFILTTKHTPAKLETSSNSLFSGCVVDVYAIPEQMPIPNYINSSDPLNRWEKTVEFLREAGIQVAFNEVDEKGFVPTNDYPWHYLTITGECPAAITTDSIIWNESSETILITEVSAIVEAYDFEPSSIPTNYKLINLFPPERGGESGDPIPFQYFKGEITPTTNAFRLLHSSQTPPIIIKSGDPIMIIAYLTLQKPGTYRIHLLFDLLDGNGNEFSLRSESFITKWIVVNELPLAKLVTIDVR